MALHTYLVGFMCVVRPALLSSWMRVKSSLLWFANFTSLQCVLLRPLRVKKPSFGLLFASCGKYIMSHVLVQFTIFDLQMVSLLHLAEITEEGVTFKSPLDGRKMLLTPEMSMGIQNNLGKRANQAGWAWLATCWYVNLGSVLLCKVVLNATAVNYNTGIGGW
jgi:hypothetical protein